MLFKFESKLIGLRDLQVVKGEKDKSGRAGLIGFNIDGEVLNPSARFWTSLFSKYGFGNAFFKYFEYDEVFERIAQRDPRSNLRVVIERDQSDLSKPGKLLGASAPEKPAIGYDDLADILMKSGSEGLRYNDGMVESFHTPRVGNGGVWIGGDEFQPKFTLHAPIDGYGLPSFYLSFLRTACANQVVPQTSTFRSQLSIGKGDEKVDNAIRRGLEGFTHEEGYSALADRVKAAQNTPASLFEANSLYVLLMRHCLNDGILKSSGNAKIDDPWVKMPEGDLRGEHPVMRSYGRMTGDSAHIYGISSIDVLTDKKKRTLPTKCTVYDLINFSTEVATHYAKVPVAAVLSQWLGSLLSKEYDLEGTGDVFSRNGFKDVLVEEEEAA